MDTAQGLQLLSQILDNVGNPQNLQKAKDIVKQMQLNVILDQLPTESRQQAKDIIMQLQHRAGETEGSVTEKTKLEKLINTCETVCKKLAEDLVSLRVKAKIDEEGYYLSGLGDTKVTRAASCLVHNAESALNAAILEARQNTKSEGSVDAEGPLPVD